MAALLQIRFVAIYAYIHTSLCSASCARTPYVRGFHRPSIETRRKAGFFVSDSSTQTEESDIIDLKHAIKTLETLTQVHA